MVLFEDGFEAAISEEELYGVERWHKNHITYDENRLVLARYPVHTGLHSLHTYAIAADSGNVSKASILRTGFTFREGDVVELSAYFYIANPVEPDDISVIDLECESCYEKAPGIRLFIKNGGYLEVERSKIGFKDSFHQGVDKKVVTDQWFHIRWRIKLGKGDEGRVTVWLDNIEVMDAQGTTMPDAGVFQSYGIILPREGYDRIEFGTTANGSDKPVTIFVDDVTVRLF